MMLLMLISTTPSAVVVVISKHSQTPVPSRSSPWRFVCMPQKPLRSFRYPSHPNDPFPNFLYRCVSVSVCRVLHFLLRRSPKVSDGSLRCYLAPCIQRCGLCSVEQLDSRLSVLITGDVCSDQWRSMDVVSSSRLHHITKPQDL
ncbi:hypothetical protein FPQ18DRAFT_318746 [Pyronema domesticum]|nr:hypothetical protein FPQ18DRAFT_318746 [Pyronema domesticum]